MALSDNKEKIRTLLNGINNLPNAGGGGNATWAGLPDKPVVMVGKPDTLEWDGDLGDRLQVEVAMPGTPFVAHLVLLSESVPSIAELKNGVTVVQNVNGASESVDVSFEDIIDYGDVIEVGSFSIAAVDNAEGTLEDGSTFVYPKAGVYGTWSDLSAVGMGITHSVSLTIPGYTGFGQEKIAPSHLWQPDWNQNDASAPDFFKNRPFGEETSRMFLIPEQVIPIDEYGSGGVELGIKPVAGNTYTVMWNGTEYDCLAQDFEMDGIPCVFLGNQIIAGGEDTGEPFAVLAVDAMGAWLVFPTDAIFEALVSIVGEATVVNKIDAKFYQVPYFIYTEGVEGVGRLFTDASRMNMMSRQELSEIVERYSPVLRVMMEHVYPTRIVSIDSYEYGWVETANGEVFYTAEYVPETN